MTRLFLSPDELVQLTGSKVIKRQIEWLKAADARFIVNAKNRPVVFRKQVHNEEAHDSGLLTRKQIVRKSISIKPVCGVYFLLNGSEIVYIGRSINLFERIGNHLRNADMKFDAYSFVEVSESQMGEVERAYIMTFNPRMNTLLADKEARQSVSLCGEKLD